MSAPDRAEAEALDRRDPLSSYRSRFELPSPGPIYMDGNSLGPLPSAVPDLLQRVVRAEWGEGLVGSWEHWIDLPSRVGSLIAGLIGAPPDDVAISDSTSVNLYKLASAAIAARPDRSALLMLEGEFPTDRYLMEGIAGQRGLELRLAPTPPGEAPQPGHVEPFLDDEVALVVLSLVSYRTSALADVEGVTAAAHRAGAIVLWDLSHAVGSVPIDLGAAGADLAVGCTYKYLNGGPGAPAFLFVRDDLQTALSQPLWGWFGHARQFAFEDSYEASPNLRRFLVGTPPILSLAAAEPGIAMVAEAGMAAIREKSVAGTELMIRFHRDRLAPLGVGLSTPLEPSWRGSHLALTHPDGLAISRRLREQGLVVTDFRAPDTIRMAFSPLVNTFTEAWDAMDTLRQVVATRSHGASPAEPRVT